MQNQLAEFKLGTHRTSLALLLSGQEFSLALARHCSRNFTRSLVGLAYLKVRCDREIF